jgi:hypothetical protein
MAVNFPNDIFLHMPIISSDRKTSQLPDQRRIQGIPYPYNTLQDLDRRLANRPYIYCMNGMRKGW